MRELVPVKVRIRNYQSLEDVEFEVAGFTCISGPTNIGKSAIVRAISGALLNAPAIKAVRKGKKFCTVELDGGDWSLKWEKSKTVSRVWIPADAEKPLTAVGRGQLDEVAAFGFQSIDVGRDKVQPWFASLPPEGVRSGHHRLHQRGHPPVRPPRRNRDQHQGEAPRRREGEASGRGR